jgi:hypothetical protein
MTTYSAVYPVAGALRRMWFEAQDENEARDFCVRCGAGLEGEAARKQEKIPTPEYYDAETACRLLGGISRTTLWKELALENLERVPNTRRVLVTRASILAWREKKGLG